MSGAQPEPEHVSTRLARYSVNLDAGRLFHSVVREGGTWLTWAGPGADDKHPVSLRDAIYADVAGAGDLSDDVYAQEALRHRLRVLELHRRAMRTVRTRLDELLDQQTAQHAVADADSTPQSLREELEIVSRIYACLAADLADACEF